MRLEGWWSCPKPVGSGAATMSGSSAAFAGRLAVFADMKPHQRVEVLLGLLGSEQRATLAATDVEMS